MNTEVVVECPCPGTPHPEGDTVRLKEEPDVPMYVAWSITFDNVAGSALSVSEWHADMQAAFAGIYLRHGIAGWTFVDEKGSVVLITPTNVNRLLPFMKGGKAVVEACDALYGDKLMAPLVEASERKKVESNRRSTKKSSGAGRTGSSTPPMSDSGPRLLVPSKPSSPSVSDGRPSEVRAS